MIPSTGPGLREDKQRNEHEEKDKGTDRMILLGSWLLNTPHLIYPIVWLTIRAPQ